MLNRRKFAVVLFGTTIGVFFLFIARFSYVVLVGKVSNESLEEKTKQLYLGSSVVKAKRGTIYDRNGDPIAEDATSYSLYAVLDEEFLGMIKKDETEREKLYVQDGDKNTIAQVLEANTNLTASYVLEQLNADSKQIEFGPEGKNLSLEAKKAIETSLDEKEIKGIYFTEQPYRIYPNGSLSSHLVGYVDANSDSGGLTGQMGIELSENNNLAGTNGEITYNKDKNQRIIPTTIEEVKAAVDGKDIYTTLDINLGLKLEEVMDEVMSKYKPESITAMLVGADTGEILAASQRPSFNPETKEGLDVWQNLLVEYPYEPGSTMKVFTVASSIELGQFDQNEYVKTGKMNLTEKDVISDWNDGQGIGTVTYRKAFAFSSNVAMVTLQQEMGQQWPEYIKRFGFTKLTGTPLKLEEPGSLTAEDNIIDMANTSYGQGVSVTPFQMVQGYTAIANEGKMLQPNYLQKIVDKDGKTEKIEPIHTGQPISANTANQTLDLMTAVVEDEDGTGKAFAIDGYRVSAKTGTAQIYSTEEGGYEKDNYLYSAVQIAPTENPDYIMYVTLKKPVLSNNLVGGQIVAEISNPVLKLALDLDVKNRVITEE